MFRFAHLLPVALLPGLVVAEDSIDFSRDIRPLLSDRCFHCHGPDHKERKAGLRLDTREGAMAPLDEEGTLFTLVPGDPDKSELFYRIITEDEDDVMPPPSSKLPGFSPEEIDLLRRWIEQGASYRDLWTFVRAERPALPEVANAKWARNGIDHFVLAKLEREGLAPSPGADRATLLRRLSFDITGLPPTVEELDAFLADESADAYEKVVDRLLKSNRYGERMAAEWMDAARYADTSGYQYDWFRTMWRWRDWVVESYNANQPYDEFVTWQLAGDLLPNATLNQKIATGFNRNHPFTIEGGVIDEEYRVSYVSDRVTTMGTVFMGLTLECARCHDHKFDPVSQKDFYQLFAFFNNLPEKGLVGGKPLSAPPSIPAPTAEQAAALVEVNAKHQATLTAMMRPDPGLDERQGEWEVALADPWTPVRPLTMISAGGAAMELLEDDSVLVTGKAAARDIYDFTLTLPAGETVTGFRVEALTHRSMFEGGPGRSANGNAVLTGTELYVGAEDAEKQLKIGAAVADYEQEGFPAKSAIHRYPDAGWAFDGNRNHADHWIVMELREPFTAENETRLRFSLRFETGYARHSFGRTRISLTSLPNPTGSDAGIRAIAAKPPEKRSAADKERMRRAFREQQPELAETVATLTKLETQRAEIEAAIPMSMIMSDALPRETFVLARGAYDQRGEKVAADTPENLPPLPDGAPRNRLGLAQWMTAREHPLTARVAVNRLWHQVFGVGIVKSVNDFGSQAEWPSHQQLLDWLAVEFMESGWDTKALIKLIVTSATYRQSSDTSAALLSRDPENRLLARGPRQRMSAEMVRDNALAVSRLLSPKIGGPSVKPYQPPGLWKELTNRKNYQHVYAPDTGDGLYRRGLYTYWKRAAHHPMMATFDAPNREVCTFSRSVTNTPLQALVLLHDPQFVEAARHLAVRLMRESNTVDGRIRLAYRVVLAREPSANEQLLMREFVQAEAAALRENPDEAAKLLAVGASPAPDDVDPIELAATTMMCRAVLNLSEAITRH